MSSLEGDQRENPIDLDVWSSVVVIEDSDDDVEIITPVAKERLIRLRNQTPQQPYEYIQQYKVTRLLNELGPRGARISVGMTVEFKLDNEDPNSKEKPTAFLRVFSIIQNTKSLDDVILRGLRFDRANSASLLPMLDAKLNEVCLVTRIYSSQFDDRPFTEQGLEEVSISRFVQKRHLILTNRPYPETSYRDDMPLNPGLPDYTLVKESVRNIGKLYCRVLFAQKYNKQMENKSTKPYEYVLRHLTFDEADEGGGILMQPGSHRPVVDVPPEPKPSPRKRKRDEPEELPYDEGAKRHTFGDVFCGAGGASCGAKMAGLEVKFGVDNSRVALETFKKNFPNAKHYFVEAQDFAIAPPKAEINAGVDILHMSPPCQFFSGAHTTVGRNDETNSSALFTVGALVKALRPRIATLEETSGLVAIKHHNWFKSMLNQLIRERYALRWSVMRCREYGCTQPRPRLFLIASAPGVPLPHFPKFTHGPEGPYLREQGMQPFTTLRRAAGMIPRGATLNDTNAPSLQFPPERERTPLDPDQPSNRTLLTNDNAVYYWTGKRKYTIRELACLQSFPSDYEFQGTHRDMKRQIGNAVPPVVYNKIIQECREVLKRLDSDRATRPRHDGPVVIPIDVEQEYEDLEVMQSVEQAQEQEMRNPTFPPAVATRAASLAKWPRDTSVTIGPEVSVSPIDIEREVIIIDDDREADPVLVDGSDDDSDAPIPRDFFIASSDEEVNRGFAVADLENFLVPAALSAPCEGRNTSATTGSGDVTSDEEGERHFSDACMKRVYDRMSKTVTGDTSRHVTPAGFERRSLTSKEEDAKPEIQYVTIDGGDEVGASSMRVSPLQTECNSHKAEASSSADASIRARGMMRALSLHPGESEGGVEGGGEESRERLGSGAVPENPESVVIVIDDD